MMRAPKKTDLQEALHKAGRSLALAASWLLREGGSDYGWTATAAAAAEAFDAATSGNPTLAGTRLMMGELFPHICEPARGVNVGYLCWICTHRLRQPTAEEQAYAAEVMERDRQRRAEARP